MSESEPELERWAPVAMLDKNLTSIVGALTGLVGFIAMVRLITSAGLGSTFAWAFIVLAMLPWIVYCTWRARHGRLTRQAVTIVLGLSALGLISVWLFTLGPVLALACSLIAFGVIWIHDWPNRLPRGEDQFVRIEELATDESAR